MHPMKTNLFVEGNLSLPACVYVQFPTFPLWKYLGAKNRNLTVVSPKMSPLLLHLPTQGPSHCVAQLPTLRLSEVYNKSGKASFIPVFVESSSIATLEKHYRGCIFPPLTAAGAYPRGKELFGPIQLRALKAKNSTLNWLQTRWGA